MTIAVMPISDLSRKRKDLLARVKREPVVVTKRGHPKAVIVDYDSYREMAARLEELDDLEDIRDMLEALRTDESESVDYTTYRMQRLTSVQS